MYNPRIPLDDDDNDDRYSDDDDDRGPGEMAICPACNGSGEGQYDGTTCSTCGGSGETWQETEPETEEDNNDPCE